MKIVYCINSICHVGGIARVVIAKANALAAIEGNEVWIAYTDIDPEHPYPALPLDERVRTVDLGIRYYADDFKGLIYRLKGNFILRRRHKKVLEKALCKIGPDVVISVGQSEKYFITSLKLPHRPAFVREFHYNRNYRHEGVSSFIGKIKALATDFYDYRLHLPRFDAIAVLTQEDYEDNWSGSVTADKTHVIPNPLTERPDTVAELNTRKVVTTGRIVYQKNHASLLRAWQIVSHRHPDWKLVIYGTGALENELHRQIDEYGLAESVEAPGCISDVTARMAECSIFALTSRFEGFGLVITEAASVGLPVVSYACPCGPRDIISDGIDGFLVEPGDEKALAERICRLIEDDKLRKRMGKASLEMSARYSPEVIAAQWMNLFNKIIDN